MSSLGSPRWDGMPHAHNPQAGEERIVNSIEEIDVLKERYRQAMEYMDWFKPAWEQLSEEERYCLETFYGDGKHKAVHEYVCQNCGRTFSAYGSRARKYCCHSCYVFARFGGAS